MKSKTLILVAMIVILGLAFFLIAKPVMFTAATAPLKDGVYEGKSCSIYTYEPYYGFAKVTIENGKISNVEFQIIDTAHNEVFDEKYERYYIGNELYTQQCRNDWKGVQTYPLKLMEAGNIDGVDAVAGATWSYNIFKDSVLQALEKAKMEKSE